MPWQTKKRVQAEIQQVIRKITIDDADIAGRFVAFQTSIDALQKGIDAINKRLNESQAAQAHTLTVSITYSQDKTKFNKTVVVTATCVDSGAHALSKASLFIDNLLVGDDTSSPYQWDLDTTKYSNADHKLKVGFWCASGGYGEKEETITVNNVKTTGGGGTQYTQTTSSPSSSSGGGTTTEAQGCVVTVTDITPPSGTVFGVDHFTCSAKGKCSENHNVLCTGGGTKYFTWDDNLRKWSRVRVDFRAVCTAGHVGTAVAFY